MTTQTLSEGWTFTEPCPFCSHPGVAGWIEDCEVCEGEGDYEVDRDVEIDVWVEVTHEPHPYGSTIAYERLVDWEIERIAIDGKELEPQEAFRVYGQEEIEEFVERYASL